MLSIITEYWNFLFTRICWTKYIIPFILGWYALQGLNVMMDQKLGLKKLCKKTILIVLGSGGHTGEMLRLLDSFDFTKYHCIYFVRSNEDRNSEIRVRRFIDSKKVRGVFQYM